MYSLIALGFVLVYKATDAINFAQGEFVMLAGLHRGRGAGGRRLPSGSPLVVALAVMIAFGFGLERVVLRPLLGRPDHRGDHGHHRPGGDAARPAADRCSAARPGRSSLPIGDEPISSGPLPLPPDPSARRGRQPDRSSPAFTWFFLKSRMGVAMRAVADNQQVAHGDGHQRRALLRARLGDGRHRVGAGRHRLGQHAGRRRAAGAGRTQGVPRGDPGRPRLRSSARWSAA